MTNDKTVTMSLAERLEDIAQDLTFMKDRSTIREAIALLTAPVVERQEPKRPKWMDEPFAMAARGEQPAPVAVVDSDQALMDRHEAWKAGEAHGIDSAAKLVEKRMDDYVNEHGSYDQETGTVEFPGNGEEYVGEMMEIIEQIQELTACIDKVKELNQSQPAHYTAVDMTTAAAQGFRDGQAAVVEPASVAEKLIKRLAEEFPDSDTMLTVECVADLITEYLTGQ